jgi:hypothetical protein
MVYASEKDNQELVERAEPRRDAQVCLLCSGPVWSRLVLVIEEAAGTDE